MLTKVTAGEVDAGLVYASDVPKVRVREEARTGEPALTEYARSKELSFERARLRKRRDVLTFPAFHGLV